MKTRVLTNTSDEESGVLFWCPGCRREHHYGIKPVFKNGVKSFPQGGPLEWYWNGDQDRPTLKPSLLCYADKNSKPPRPQCHLFLTDGALQFLNDCEHDHAGKTVSLPEIPKESPWAE